MLTREEQEALEVLDKITISAIATSTRLKPGAFVMSLSSQTREKLRGLTSKATQSLRPDALLM